MARWIKPVTLQGEHAQLEPLTLEHCDALAEAARDGELWNLWFTHIPRSEQVRDYVQDALNLAEHEGALPFAVRDRASGQVIGTTRYFAVDDVNRRLEIGYTWYAQSMQRTAINTECKLLLLTHAFETLEAIAVEFRTHWHNHASRAAIARLGAKQDGVLRNHKRLADGSYRDTVVFSIIESEWLAVKRSLTSKLLRHRPEGA